MIEAGYSYVLRVINKTNFGFFLEDEEEDSVLLPRVLSDRDYRIEDEVEVFIYHDDKGRLVATTQEPIIYLHEFALLKCTGTAVFGAFMHWGLERDLLVPNSLQVSPIQEGEEHVVYLFSDDKGRLTGSTIIPDHLETDFLELKQGEEVDILVYESSKLGLKVIIDNIYDGLVYADDIYKPMPIGTRTKGYISKLREDGKIDVSLRRFGYKKVKDETDNIIELLESAGGFLPYHDKTDAEVIKSNFQMSKKVFKKALGALYKKKIIRIAEDGIYLSPQKQATNPHRVKRR